MFEEFFIDLSQTAQDAEVGAYLITHLDEGADDKHAHRDGVLTSQNHRGHDGTVFGKNP